MLHNHNHNNKAGLYLICKDSTESIIVIVILVKAGKHTWNIRLTRVESCYFQFETYKLCMVHNKYSVLNKYFVLSHNTSSLALSSVTLTHINTHLSPFFLKTLKI